MTYIGNDSALSGKAKTLLSALAMKLERGEFITVTGYAYGNSSLAKKRALIVSEFLESRVAVRVTVKIVTTSSVPKVMVTTTKV